MRLALFLVIAASAAAQQFVWEGEVDGVVTLNIRGKRMAPADVRGAPVRREKFRFYSALPGTRQPVRLEVRQGRGSVRIVDQPRLDNDYSLSIQIEDLQPGASFYSIALYWETDRSEAEDREFLRDKGELDRVVWSGRVEGEVIVSCHAKVCESRAQRGGPPLNEKFKFTRPLPANDAPVSLDGSDGPGEVRLIEQPRASNQYTARVLIRDGQPGISDYSFTLSWPRRQASADSKRAFSWWGRVDGEVRVTVQGEAARTEVIAGLPVAEERSQFERPLPNRDGLVVSLKKATGRGTAEVVEYPTNRNGYRLVFIIKDSATGAGRYRIDVSW